MRKTDPCRTESGQSTLKILRVRLVYLHTGHNGSGDEADNTMYVCNLPYLEIPLSRII